MKKDTFLRKFIHAFSEKEGFFLFFLLGALEAVGGWFQAGSDFSLQFLFLNTKFWAAFFFFF